MASQDFTKIEVVKSGGEKIHVDPIADPLMHPALRNISQEFLLSERIKNTLDTVLCKNNKSYTCVMSMLFGLKSGTPGHQDAYYLSSLPHGHVHAIWIALQNIEKNAGPFWVLKKTQDLRELELPEKLIHDADLYEKHVTDYVKEIVRTNKGQIVSPELKAGSVLIWNVNTIHGSFKESQESLGRLSFTAHYIPDDVQFTHNSYNNKIRKLRFLETPLKIKLRITTTYETKDLSNNNVRSFDNFGKLDPN
jgi:phytanoyl-CoA hydroxylase